MPGQKICKIQIQIAQLSQECQQYIQIGQTLKFDNTRQQKHYCEGLAHCTTPTLEIFFYSVNTFEKKISCVIRFVKTFVLEIQTSTLRYLKITFKL